MKTRALALCILLALPAAVLGQAGHPPETSSSPADREFERGMALARQKRWQAAKQAFKAGQKHYPRDKRFPLELAGIAFKRKRFGEARKDLHRALRLDPNDSYALNFLATLYFLDGNLTAALKYWNRVGKPQIAEIRTPAGLQVDPELLSRSFTCAPESLLSLSEYRATRARLQQLGIFPAFRLNLAPHAGGNTNRFDLRLSAVERNGWGEGKLGGVLSLLRGVPYETVYPEYFNLRHAAFNIQSLVRWDDQKRRLYASVSAPLAGNPQFRYQFFADARNENWDVSRTFNSPGSTLKRFNMEQLEAGGGIRSIVNGRASWAAGLVLSDRRFRDLPPGVSDPLFTGGFALEVRGRGDYASLRMPERRFTLTAGTEASLGKLYAPGFGDFSRLQGALAARWFPQARGDDYEVKEGFHAGKTFGQVPFDELFMLGLERDNHLPLRAHVGTRDGRKGNAPLGRDYLLSNWEINKNLYSNGWFKLRLAPFLDTGRIYGSSLGFGSRRWLWDTGGEAKVSILGGVSIIFTYGKDLRTGQNAFYVTTEHDGGRGFFP